MKTRAQVLNNLVYCRAFTKGRKQKKTKHPSRKNKNVFSFRFWTDTASTNPLVWALHGNLEMEQTPSERADGTRLNHGSCFCRSSTHKLALALAIMVKKPLLQSGLAEGREGRMGRSSQDSKSTDPFWEMFLHQPISSRQDWVSFQDHRNCLPCQCIFTVSCNPVLSAVLL